MPKQPSFDPACGDLAEHFLANGASKDDINDLAAEIQNAVENWLLTREIEVEVNDYIKGRRQRTRNAPC